MDSQTLWIVDTQNRSLSLVEDIESSHQHVENLNATSALAQTLASRSDGAVIANIHENEDFETLEHLSKISLTYPEIPMVLLLPEPLQAAMDWGPRVFNLIKPVSAESILKRLSFLDEHSYPSRGILQRGSLLALLDHCLVQKKNVRVVIRHGSEHVCELLIQAGKWRSLYLDNSLRNEKLLLPFALDGAEFSMEHLPEPDTDAETESKFWIRENEYRRFRLELHPFLSLIQQFPPLADVLQIDDGALVKVLNSLPEQVHSVIRYFDGIASLYKIFRDCELRPLETAQRIGYLYFSDVFRNTDSQKTRPVDNMPGVVPSPMPDRSSSELAGWLLNPVAAARELEKKIKKEVREQRKARDVNFRPHRKTQPGLGNLLRPVLEEESDNSEEAGAWGGVNNRLLRESQQMLLKMSDDSNSGGLIMEMEDLPEDETASGVIDVLSGEQPVLESSGSPKVILDSEPMFSGESVIPPETDSPPLPAFHDEPTMPLEQETEESLQIRGDGDSGNLQLESLSELRALRSGDRVKTMKMASVDPLFADLEKPPADDGSEPNEAPETEPVHQDEPGPGLGADTPDILQPADNGEPEIPEEEPAPFVTPEPSETEDIVRLTPDRRAESTLQDAVLNFQKPKTGGNRSMVYFMVIIAVAALGIWYVYSSSGGEMKPSGKTTEKPLNNPVSGDSTPSVKQPEKPVKSPETPETVSPQTPNPFVEPPPKEEPLPTTDATAVPVPQPVVEAEEKPDIKERAEHLYQEYTRRYSRHSLAELEKMAEEHPDVAVIFAFLGDINYKRGRIAVARRQAQRAVELDPDSEIGWWNVGLIAYEAGQRAEFVKAFQNVLRLAPEGERARRIRQLRIRELQTPK